MKEITIKAGHESSRPVTVDTILCSPLTIAPGNE